MPVTPLDLTSPSASLSAPSSPSPTKPLSQSAPESQLLGDSHHERQQVDIRDDVLSPTKKLRDKERRHLHKSHSSISSYAHQLVGNNITPNSDGSRYDINNRNNSETDTDALDRSGEGETGGSDKKQHLTGKKRSTWRHLLSPSYKSRSEEFHKLFAEEIPGNERLIADYSCALHREILIQGRVYVSINYIAFYSNLFSWITKLVVRLRDIVEIYKANTARIIPNAIQIVTNTDEKHVFASFIARDKSYTMIWRIWRNNLLKERLSDQEIRSLVHLGYGKDLGMGDDEELKINSPDPRTPTDGNNNDSDRSRKRQSRDGVAGDCNLPESNTCDIRESEAYSIGEREENSKASRCNSVDQTATDSSETKGQISISTQNRVTGKLCGQVMSNSLEESQADDGAANLSNYSTGSAVILATPDTNNGRSHLRRTGTDNVEPDDEGREHKAESRGKREESSKCLPTPTHDVGALSLQVLAHDEGRHELPSQATDDRRTELTHLGTESDGSDKETVGACSRDHQNGASSDVASGSIGFAKGGQARIDDCRVAADCNYQAAEQTTSGPQLNTKCDCEQHQGVVVCDEEFDINVDTLFSLIFTNTKFMRSYMIKRGMTDMTVSKWNRTPSYSGSINSIQSGGGDGGGGGGGGGRGGGGSDGTTATFAPAEVGGDDDCGGAGAEADDNKSNCSLALSPPETRGRQNSIDSFNIHLSKTPVKHKQVRQLNYSIDVNHVWAKQVQVEERQRVYLVKPGVYVLKSQTINSGIPCGEAFTVDLTYCLTQTSDLDKSRMLVHGHVNFIKNKQSWKIAMVKSLIEKESMQGINDFIGDLIGCIREYVENKKKKTGESKIEATKSVKGSKKNKSLDPSVARIEDIKALSANHEQEHYPARHCDPDGNCDLVQRRQQDQYVDRSATPEASFDRKRLSSDKLKSTIAANNQDNGLFSDSNLVKFVALLLVLLLTTLAILSFLILRRLDLIQEQLARIGRSGI